MLNQDTKRKIDSARQILVGKVPDPKAQVEQITTALIYKFMDDTDKEAQVLGGKARYFTNGYEKYAWSKIMDVRLGGHDRLNLYFEAVSNLGRNKHIPQIFRDIFGDRALPPYRDAQTLTLFLKEINGFDFEHSEDLGDAYEFLLNVIGTSGEAGQFRTPRHLIDFIAAAVDPKKNETILDPACGTAGFLISAYKHILKQHDGLDDPEKTEKPLTPDEKKSLMNHFVGYDIDPGMVRIATVNMYLHNFPEPKIFEYDTLAYEDRWDETYDVVLANPPFFSANTKAIQPSKRFSIKAKRAEVLFVDYIADHLNINGKAGVIVPEGIIFNNQTAYKNLRKKLVEDYLIAVISLPQGVFIKPGGKGNVKTGVLIFDKALAKKTKDVLFVKISNDGFDLGAQRRVIDKNDLPLALGIIKKFKSALKDGKSFDLNGEESEIAHLASKNAIAETGDYNLTGERYKEVIEQINQKWEMVELGEVCEIQKGTSITKAKVTEGKIPVIAGGQQPAYYHNESNREGKTITVSASGAYAGFVNYFDYPIFASDCTTIKTKDENILLTDYIFSLLKSKQAEIYKFQNGAGQPHVYGKDLAKIKIPLPPIVVQKEIVEQIEVKQNAIDHAKAIIQNIERERRYFGQALRKLEGVEWVELGEICNLEYGFTDTANDKGNARFIRITDIDETGMIKTEEQKFINLTEEAKKYLLKKDDLVVARTGATYGKTATFKESYPAVFASYLIKLDFESDKMLPDFYWLFAQTDEYWNQAKKLMTGGGQQQFNGNAIKKIIVPIVPIATQKRFIAEAEKEQEVINANKQLIEIMERKISDVLSEI